MAKRKQSGNEELRKQAEALAAVQRGEEPCPDSNQTIAA
jgi:hypothetical protein